MARLEQCSKPLLVDDFGGLQEWNKKEALNAAYFSKSENSDLQQSEVKLPFGLLWKSLQVVRYIFAVIFTLELILRDMMEAGEVLRGAG